LLLPVSLLINMAAGAQRSAVIRQVKQMDYCIAINGLPVVAELKLPVQAAAGGT
jgi:hypothetical protein